LGAVPAEAASDNGGLQMQNVQIFNSDLDGNITEREVIEAIKNLKIGKAAGLDEISAEFLKTTTQFFSKFLTKLFNRLYDLGTFPDMWSRSVIFPLFKKGNPNCPENYRGISLLSIVSKLFTSILNKRLYTWAEVEEKISVEQAGFRRGYSTIDHIFTLISMIKNSFNHKPKRKLYVAFVDYKKAFDSVDREKLWSVLQKLKTSSKMIRMLQGIYKSVQSCVKWGSETSELFDCPSGVKQGCMLSPLIFSLLITEVADCVTENGKHGFQFLPNLKEIFLLLFADDICLISSTPLGLQNQIKNLEAASSSLGLTVNLKKTKVMIFRKGGKRARTEHWFYKGDEIEVVNSYKYLGFTLTTQLSYNIALSEFAGRAKGKVVELLKTMWNLGTMDLAIFLKLFDSQVKPLLLYASEIWGSTQFHVIEVPHLFACKRFLGIPRYTPNAMVYGDMGRYPLFIDSMVRTVKYWLKLQCLEDSRLPRQAYLMDKNRAIVHNVKNWTFGVKSCLDNYGFSHVWLDGGVGNPGLFIKLLKQRMIDSYLQSWHSKLQSSDRYLTFRSFKSLFYMENYHYYIDIYKFRNAFIKMRFGVNELNVNNHFNNLSKNCNFCNSIEDELHFILFCPPYAALRMKYIYKHFDNLNNIPLNELLNNPNPAVVKSIAMYIFYGLRLRETLTSS